MNPAFDTVTVTVTLHAKLRLLRAVRQPPLHAKHCTNHEKFWEVHFIIYFLDPAQNQILYCKWTDQRITSSGAISDIDFLSALRGARKQTSPPADALQFLRYR